MYKVIIERACGCVRRANMPTESVFTEKDDALVEAGRMAQEMSDDFCGKHNFSVQEAGEDFLITMQMRG